VPDEVKQQRVEELMLTQQEIAFGKAKSMIGNKIEVLIDRVSTSAGVPTSAGMSSEWTARSSSQAPEIDSVVRVSSPDTTLHAGQFVSVKVRESQGYDLLASVPLRRSRTLPVLVR
jgi:ribosomal protein S12 methylthiotransferase